MDSSKEEWTRYKAERARILADFGGKLAGRRDRGESQEALAARAGLHRNEIGLLEGGKREPRLLTLLALAKTFDITLNELAEDLPAPQTKRPRSKPPRK
jgi:transcriptional regulator with XRE-family HTH domain